MLNSILKLVDHNRWLYLLARDMLLTVAVAFWSLTVPAIRCSIYAVGSFMAEALGTISAYLEMD